MNNDCLQHKSQLNIQKKNQSFKLVHLKTHIILFYVFFKEKYLTHYDMYMNSYIVQRQFMNYIYNL